MNRPFAILAFALACQAGIAQAQALQILAPEGYIMWDTVGQHGDTILVTLKPRTVDVNRPLDVALYLEGRPGGQGNWLPIPFDSSGNAVGRAVFMPRNQDAIDVSLRIPSSAYKHALQILPAGQHELRYRIRTSNPASEYDPNPGTPIDDLIVPGTITATFNARNAPPGPISVRTGGTVTPQPNTSRNAPVVTPFRLNAPQGGS
jgi:hypothetical protein